MVMRKVSHQIFEAGCSHSCTSLKSSQSCFKNGSFYGLRWRKRKMTFKTAIAYIHWINHALLHSAHLHLKTTECVKPVDADWQQPRLRDF